jgi:hypothetical protein
MGDTSDLVNFCSKNTGRYDLTVLSLCKNDSNDRVNGLIRPIEIKDDAKASFAAAVYRAEVSPTMAGGLYFDRNVRLSQYIPINSELVMVVRLIGLAKGN